MGGPLNRVCAVLFAFVASCSFFVDTGGLSGSPASTPIDGGGGDARESAESGPTPDGAVSDGSNDGRSGPDASCDLRLPVNCGACGNDCSGGTCSAGLCTLATVVGATDLTVSGDTVYVAAFGEGTIGRCPRAGCQGATLTTIPLGSAPGVTSPYALKVWGANLYFTSADTFDGGGAWVGPIAGGVATRLHTDDRPGYALALSATHVLWDHELSLGGGLYGCPFAGCAGPAVNIGGTSAEVGALGVAPDGSIVWGSGGSVKSCATPSCIGGPVTLATSQGFMSGVAFNGGDVYWASTYPSEQIVRRALLGVASPVPVVALPKLPSAILIVGSTLYFALAGTNPNAVAAQPPLKPTTDGVVRKCALPDCNNVVDVATGQAAPWALATDGAAIYWVNSGAAGIIGAAGAVMKAPL